MALVKCPECGGNVSDKAKACPNCGYPIYEMINNIDSERQNEKDTLIGDSDVDNTFYENNPVNIYDNIFTHKKNKDKKKYDISERWQEYVEDHECKNAYQRKTLHLKRYIKKHKKNFIVLSICS